MSNHSRVRHHIRTLIDTFREQDPDLAHEVDQIEKVVARGLQPENAFDSSLETESIIMRRLRPVLDIGDNTTVLDFATEMDSRVWRSRLVAARELLDVAIPSIGRINLTNAGLDWVGTGWLADDNIMVTNRHVAVDFAQANGADYEFSTGRDGKIGADIDFLQEFDNPAQRVFQLVRPLYIAGDEDPDIAFFEVEQSGGDGDLSPPLTLAAQPAKTRNAATIGYPAFDSRIPETDLMEQIYGRRYNKKRLAPGGVTGLEEIELLHNCTTLGGNSGSAVLDLDSGEVLGLHFSGAFLRSNYAVRADLLNDVLGRVRAGRRPFYQRQAGLDTSPRVDAGMASGASAAHTVQPVSVGVGSASAKGPVKGDVRITVPLTITVSLGGVQAAQVQPPDPDPDDHLLDLTEARVEDYRDRKGYDPAFIGAEEGHHVPLPEIVDPSEVLSFDLEGRPETELRYQHFSVVMNRPRRLCILSAVNIDGANTKSTSRRRWRLDPRIPKDVQIIKECYGNPPKFSRGHMTRRNDPGWGDIATARLANRDTMHVTNAAPQMQSFNSPVWLELEDYALDNAVMDDMRISVFTGPYFREDDPVHFGVKIPVHFWKIIVFRHDVTGDLTATGYEMDQSQSLIARDDAEDEFVFGAFRSSHLDIAVQVPIRQIERAAGLDFGPLAERDPLSMEEGVSARRRTLRSLQQIRFY